MTTARPETDPQLRPALERWRALAENEDLHDLALALDTALEPGDEPSSRRASYLACRGEFAAALRAAGHRPEDPGPEPDDVLVTACRAALGDDDAFRRLMGRTSSPDWLPVYLAAVAAEARGSRVVADQLWLAALDRTGVLTGFLYPRWACATLSRRGRQDPGSAAGTVRDVVRATRHLLHSPADEPGPLLATADLLLSRGDLSGAELFLGAVLLRYPDAAGLAERAEELKRHGTPGPWWRLGQGRSTLTDADAELWSRVRRQSAAEPEDPRPAPPEPAESAEAPAPEAGDPGQGAGAACRCLQERTLVDEAARRYLRDHLDPAEVPAEAVVAVLGPHAVLATCPQSGVLWLGVPQQGTPVLLLSGAAATTSLPAPRRTGDS